MERIIIFGGSFDPIHLGHILIARKAIDFLHADKCIFMPSLNPRWKILKTTPLERVEMLNIALTNEEKMEISLEEINAKEEINYTYNTIKRLQEKKQAEYFLLIGSDQANRLNEWYNIDELKSMVQIVSYKRKNYEFNKDNLLKYNVKIIDDVFFDISSTEIRNLIKLYTKKEILDYIALHNLYYINKLKEFMSTKRLNHSLSVASLAFEIAQKNNLNPYKAYQAGLLHDIAREYKSEEMRKIMEENYVNYIKQSAFTYHQFVAEKILKEEFHIDDEEIINAIKYHCTGNVKMTPLGKIIYCADKIDPLRNYDSTPLIKSCFNDYEKGFIDVLKANKEFLESKNVEKNILSEECYKYYLERKKQCSN